MKLSFTCSLFSLQFFCFVLKIAAGVLLNKTSDEPVYFRVCVVVLIESLSGFTAVILRYFLVFSRCYTRHVFN